MFVAGLLLVFAVAVFAFAFMLDAGCWHALAERARANVAERNKSVDGFKAKMRMKRLSLKGSRGSKGESRRRRLMFVLQGTA
jgi:outer membrane lipoprotein-sorting protein